MAGTHFDQESQKHQREPRGEGAAVADDGGEAVGEGEGLACGDEEQQRQRRRVELRDVEIVRVPVARKIDMR